MSAGPRAAAAANCASRERTRAQPRGTAGAARGRGDTARGATRRREAQGREALGRTGGAEHRRAAQGQGPGAQPPPLLGMTGAERRGEGRDHRAPPPEESGAAQGERERDLRAREGDRVGVRHGDRAGRATAAGVGGA